MYIHTLLYEYTLTKWALGIDKRWEIGYWYALGDGKRWEFVIDVPTHKVSGNFGPGGADSLLVLTWYIKFVRSQKHEICHNLRTDVHSHARVWIYTHKSSVGDW